MADSVQRFIFEEEDVRGELVHLEQSYQHIMDQHQYPSHVRKVLGEILVSALLLSGSLKFEGELTIQFQGTGVIQMLVAKCSNELGIRGLAQWDATASPEAFHEAFGEGQLVITLQLADNPQYYQSMVPLEHKTVAASLELYFQQSEQLTTKLWLVASDMRAAGLLLQVMPDVNLDQKVDFWERVVSQAKTVDADTLLLWDNLMLLDALYPEDDLRIFAEREVRFCCSCNVEKMEQAVVLLGEADAKALLALSKEIVVRCEFCNCAYTFDSIDVAHIFSKHKGQAIH